MKALVFAVRFGLASPLGLGSPLGLARFFGLVIPVGLAVSAALFAGPALARDGVPGGVPQPPASARTLPDTCLGTSCSRKVDPGRSGQPCLGTSCGGARYPEPASGANANRAPPPWSGPAQPRLPPLPQRGQPSGPLTPGPALPR